MTTGSSTTFDPTSTATSLATAYTAGRQAMLTTQTNAATAATTALTKLQSALNSFNTALTGLSASAGSSVLTQSAVCSDTAVASATATPAAVAGSYSFFVQQLATANQQVFGNLAAVAKPAAGSGNVVIHLPAAPAAGIAVDFATADTDADGQLSPAELASAINAAPANTALVTASVITVGTQSKLVLTANATGAASAITLDTSGLAAGALKSSLTAGTQLVAAQDAIVYLGADATGIPLQQASNTFAAVAGVSITFKQAMATGATPLTVTVSTDQSATANKLQAFVDAYNALENVLDGLTSTGNAASGVAAGPFANDSAVRSLRSRIESTIRQSIGGVTLASYGISADRYGTLSLDRTRLNKQLAAHPGELTALFGNTATTGGAGVLGAIDTYLKSWTGSSGQIKHRQAELTRLQATLAARQTTLDKQYDNAYARYLAQFTQLATLQAQMTHTSDLFDALFSDSSSG